MCKGFFDMSMIEKALKKAYEQKNVKGGIKKEISGDTISVKKHARKVSSKAGEQLLSDAQDYLEGNQLSDKRIIFPQMENVSISNVFRDLRTQLLQKSPEENFVVLITSVVDGSDSGFVTLNLAKAFSLEETKTSLVVDCEFNESWMQSTLSLNEKNGVLEYLTGMDVSVGEIITEVGIPQLRMIPPGSDAGFKGEYFNSKRMLSLLSDLTERYDDRYIFINAPSVNTSADTKILADMCDFILLVLPYSKATESELKKVLSVLPADKIVGVVFNNIPLE